VTVAPAAASAAPATQNSTCHLDLRSLDLDINTMRSIAPASV
jgi:hypothetical protein